MNAWGYGAGNWLDTRYTQVTLDVILASWRLFIIRIRLSEIRLYFATGQLYLYSAGVREPHIWYGNHITKAVQYTAYYRHQGEFSGPEIAQQATILAQGDICTSMQCIRLENPPNGTNTDSTGRRTRIDGTACPVTRPVKVGGKSTMVQEKPVPYLTFTGPSASFDNTKTHNPAVTAPTFWIISNGCAASGMAPIVAFHVLGQHKGAQVVLSEMPILPVRVMDPSTELAVPEYEKYGGGK
ncbi:hypothetical protein C8F01DRAFT_1084134 [Mycena amicta]|nr:hypothetical protein C8F01DRAFT_1084134 [Mycena amicta]